MTSLVNIRRNTGGTSVVDGYEVPDWQTVLTDVPFRLVDGTSHPVVVGGVTFEEATGRGDMPWDTFDLADGDLLDITEGDWTGTVVRVVKAIKGDQQTARRVPVVEVPRPEEWT